MLCSCLKVQSPSTESNFKHFPVEHPDPPRLACLHMHALCVLRHLCNPFSENPGYRPYVAVSKYRLITHCKKGKVVLTQFGYLSFLLLVCIVKHSDVPLPALDSKQIKNLIRLSRPLVNVMGEYFANEIIQSCGKWYETEVTAMG